MRTSFRGVRWSGGDLDRGAAGGGGPGDGVDDREVAQAVLEAGDPGQAVDAGDLLEEGASLVPEQVPRPERDSGEVHRQTALDVRVRRPDEDLVEPVEAVVAQLSDHRELGGPVHVPTG